MPRSLAWTSLRLCSATAFALALAPLAACGEEEVEDAGLTSPTASGSGTSTTAATGTESDTSGGSTSTTGTGTSTSTTGTGTSTTGTPTTGTSTTGTGTTGTTGTTGMSTTGGANCGNGTIDQGEQCDGTNLGSFTRCEQITATEVGPLACDPMTCMYDLSMCMAGGTSGATGG